MSTSEVLPTTTFHELNYKSAFLACLLICEQISDESLDKASLHIESTMSYSSASQV